jgi:hypothetical protein
VNRALVDARQLRIAFARLSTTLRLPAGEDGEQADGVRSVGSAEAASTGCRAAS